MDGAAGEEDTAALRVAFDPRLKLEFHGSKVTSDAGLLAFRDLDDALGLTDLAGRVFADTRTGQNSRHTASTSQMGRFETEVLTQEANLSALADLSARISRMPEALRDQKCRFW